MGSETTPIALEAAEPRSAGMQRVMDLVRRVAKVDAPVVFEGERGTGKERLARLVHGASARAAGPFVSVSSAHVPERLLESELFGHARGAFPGASGERAGLFEAARGGTLLIEDITDMPSAIQAKLVRALEDRKVRRMGEIASRAFDVRVIASATRKLTDAVMGGRFRRDLAERLSGVVIPVPPLRDRKDDVLPLARQMLARAAARTRRDDLVLAPTAVDALLVYGWPGNERELENAMERAAAASPTPLVEATSLPEEVRLGKASPRGLDKVRPLEDIEKEYILAALAHNHGNQTRTAHELRIGTTTLYRKLKAYGLSKARKPAVAAAPPPPASELRTPGV
ncbi:MAG TPA: sigma-54 dependent transcriptional regulator, partial [Minicystis sp.]|nr:sigma-54 dependent transcriptional regulator [Minicystis sp.]